MTTMPSPGAETHSKFLEARQKGRYPQAFIRGSSKYPHSSWEGIINLGPTSYGLNTQVHRTPTKGAVLFYSATGSGEHPSTGVNSTLRINENICEAGRLTPQV